MNKFLKNLGQFIFPIIITLIIIEFIFRTVPNQYSNKFNYVKNNELKGIGILYFGSSYTLRGINPNKSKYGGYNLANVNQSIDLDYKIHTHTH